MNKQKAIHIPLDMVKIDSALMPHNKGSRKILVTEIYKEREKEIYDDIWIPPKESEKCPVQIMIDTEIAVFTNYASQDQHYHLKGTEIYIVIDGEMLIEVEGKEYDLEKGDTIVVNPGAIHKVKPQMKQFICYVITVNCGGVSDKFIYQKIE